jgi:hypothetical protein
MKLEVVCPRSMDECRFVRTLPEIARGALGELGLIAAV